MDRIRIAGAQRIRPGEKDHDAKAVARAIEPWILLKWQICHALQIKRDCTLDASNILFFCFPEPIDGKDCGFGVECGRWRDRCVHHRAIMVQ